jgi:hypothetical protein
VAPSIARRGARHFLAGKLRTVFVPMVLWNALAIVLVSGAALAGWIYAPQPVSVWWVVNELLCLITPDDINVQIPFLRDLFLCMLAVPLLVRRSDRALLGVAGFALVWSLAPVWVPVLLRPPSCCSLWRAWWRGAMGLRHGWGRGRWCWWPCPMSPWPPSGSGWRRAELEAGRAIRFFSRVSIW